MNLMFVAPFSKTMKIFFYFEKLLYVQQMTETFISAERTPFKWTKERWGQRDQICRNLATLTKHIKTGKILMVYLVPWKNSNQLWQKNYATGQFFIVVNGQILNSYIVIWSLWMILSATHFLLSKTNIFLL